jgi:hypothetical protein
MKLDPLARRLAFALPLAAASVALAQANPLEPAGPANAGGNPFETRPAPAVPSPLTPGVEEKLKVPDFIKPGARLVYKTASRMVTSDRPPYTTATGGMYAYDVVAVTDSRVYLAVGHYMDDGQGGQELITVVPQITRQADVVGAGALWITKELLAQLGGGKEQTVEATGHVGLDGRKYEADSLTWRGGETVRRTVWDRGTGLLLSRQSATGRGVEFERPNSDVTLFVGYRAVKLPWAGGEAPGWSRTVRRMQYQGGESYRMPGLAPYSTPVEWTVEFGERVGGATLGRWTLTQAVWQQQPVSQSAEFATAPAGRGEQFWLPPQLLATLETGVLDQDPSLGTTLTFERRQTPAGEVAFLTETNANRTSRSTRGYRLSDGAMVLIEFEQARLGRTRSLQLVGME